ncbi:dihydroxyacetone kinase transcriptional activator DhaS, partial [Acinetobacter baumannii]|nr:dihydroxyacetone kinase transcriptional activator DhaS [Acinetobacter baumannii]
MVSNGSLITKKVIAYSLKALMKTKDFEKIAIKEIMEHADYRRQTFYDHFSDKYELLDWIYEQEITEIIEHFISYEHWTKIIPRMLHYFEKNKQFYQNALSIKNHYS